MWIAIAIIVLLVIWVISVYNGLISSKQKADNARPDFRSEQPGPQ